MEEAHLNLYKSLNKNKVKYLIVGGMASIIYGSPRLTKDIDILIESTIGNATRLLVALKEAQFGTAQLTSAEKIIKNEVTIFKDYIRLDVLTKIKGVEFFKAWQSRVIKRIDKVRIFLISLDELITSKKAAGRQMDLEDVVILKRIKTLKKKCR